jgi:hypothetical protein
MRNGLNLRDLLAARSDKKSPGKTLGALAGAQSHVSASVLPREGPFNMVSGRGTGALAVFPS